MTTIIIDKKGRRVLPVTRGNRQHHDQGAKLEMMFVGNHIELKPCGRLAAASWPPGFFDRIAIDDPAFARPPQGTMPAGVEF